MNSDTLFLVVVIFSSEKTFMITEGPLFSLQRVKVQILAYSERTIAVRWYNNNKSVVVI